VISLDDLTRLPDSPEVRALIKRELQIRRRAPALTERYERALRKAASAADVSSAARALAEFNLRRLPPESREVTSARRATLAAALDGVTDYRKKEAH
jgi:hypothetical protein